MSMSEDRTLDGNAAAGLLGEVFAMEATTAMVTCAGCGSYGPLAAAAVYASAMGTVVRCKNCDAVLIRAAEQRERVIVDMRGAAAIALAVPG
jgi:hypothetical protein